jgi:hypothetical protein
MTTLKHVVIRLYLSALLVLFFVTGGAAMFVLAPLYKGAFAPRAPWRAVRPFAVWAHVYKVMWRSISNKGYRDLYPSKLTDPPQYHNDYAVMRIRESWQGAKDNCSECRNSCCAQIKCPMLDAGGLCISYGSVYFGYYFCGRYPSNQGQVGLYDCPKWEVQPEK